MADGVRQCKRQGWNTLPPQPISSFHILKVHISNVLDGKRISLNAGDLALAQKNLNHIYHIKTNRQRAQVAAITTGGAYEKRVRRATRSASQAEL